MSASLDMKQRDLENHKFRGLADHGRHPLDCTACGAPLAEILLVDPQIPVTFSYRADCPHCGDHSFTKEVTGQIYLVSNEYTVCDGHRDPLPGEPEGVVYLKTSKVKEYASE
jgi:hypothetical protein